MNFLFGDPLTKVPDKASRAVKNLATPAPVGSGPEGMTCRQCEFYTRVDYQAGTYLKCGLMQKQWTHGAGTDIRAKWPACSEFKAADTATEEQARPASSMPDHGATP